MTEVPINQQTNPKHTVEIKLEDLTMGKPECFGEYTVWPCDGYGNKGPCPFIPKCKEAKDKTVFMT